MIFGVDLVMVLLGVVVAMILLGFPIVISLGATSLLGAYLTTGSASIALSMLASTGFEALRDYIFAVVPLFILMGEFVSRSGIARDLYRVLNRTLHKLPGHLAAATIFGNAIFAAVVGVSVASAAAFSRIAYPEMRRHGYSVATASGSVAGSAALGMLIPPSVLMIVWGVAAEVSIGNLFLAGVFPGIVLTLTLVGMVIIHALLSPASYGRNTKKPDETDLTRREILGSLYVGAMVLLVLGGIWAGFFTPTEAAGIGALAGLALGLARGMNFRQVLDTILSTGRISAPIMMLLLFAQLYARVLALGGAANELELFFNNAGLTPLTSIIVMMLVWLALGMFVDSISIILLTVPLFAPIAISAGVDPLAFAIIGILVIEAGLISPPFGLVIFTVKMSVPERDAPLSAMFLGSFPYLIVLIVLAWLVYWVPGLATWLPKQI